MTILIVGVIDLFFEKMSDLAGDITFDERKVDELYTICCAKYELKVRRKRRNYCSMTIIAVILLICMCTTLHNLNSTIVYASGIEGKNSVKRRRKDPAHGGNDSTGKRIYD